MEESSTCVDELEELALALETELEPRVAQQLAYTLEMIRSGKALMLAELRRKRRWFVEWQTSAGGSPRRQEGKGGIFGEEILRTPL
jgi:hypothetical protein